MKRLCLLNVIQLKTRFDERQLLAFDAVELPMYVISLFRGDLSHVANAL